MIEFGERRGHLYLIYEQDYGADGWIERRFESDQAVVMSAQTARMSGGNPKAIIVGGRSEGLSAQQLFDFELVKRKYANIVDILSYDDLLARLSIIIKKFRTAPATIARGRRVRLEAAVQRHKVRPGPALLSASRVDALI